MAAEYNPAVKKIRDFTNDAKEVFVVPSTDSPHAKVAVPANQCPIPRGPAAEPRSQADPMESKPPSPALAPTADEQARGASSCWGSQHPLSGAPYHSCNAHDLSAFLDEFDGAALTSVLSPHLAQSAAPLLQFQAMEGPFSEAILERMMSSVDDCREAHKAPGAMPAPSGGATGTGSGDMMGMDALDPLDFLVAEDDTEEMPIPEPSSSRATECEPISMPPALEVPGEDSPKLQVKPGLGPREASVDSLSTQTCRTMAASPGGSERSAASTGLDNSSDPDAFPLDALSEELTSSFIDLEAMADMPFSANYGDEDTVGGVPGEAFGNHPPDMLTVFPPLDSLQSFSFDCFDSPDKGDKPCKKRTPKGKAAQKGSEADVAPARKRKATKAATAAAAAAAAAEAEGSPAPKRKATKAATAAAAAAAASAAAAARSEASPPPTQQHTESLKTPSSLGDGYKKMTKWRPSGKGSAMASSTMPGVPMQPLPETAGAMNRVAVPSQQSGMPQTQQGNWAPMITSTPQRVFSWQPMTAKPPRL